MVHLIFFVKTPKAFANCVPSGWRFATTLGLYPKRFQTLKELIPHRPNAFSVAVYTFRAPRVEATPGCN
jgi:hypothetical protein